MMHEELKKQLPDIFSIPGEIEIKQYISPLFPKSKSNLNDTDIDTELNLKFKMIAFVSTSYICIQKILKI